MQKRSLNIRLVAAVSTRAFAQQHNFGAGRNVVPANQTQSTDKINDKDFSEPS
jgi:hypothetical protein